MCACPLIEGESESEVTQLCLTPWTIACQAPSFQDFPGKNTGVGCCFLLQGIFPTQGSNLGLLHFRQTRQSEPPGKPCSLVESTVLYWLVSSTEFTKGLLITGVR